MATNKSKQEKYESIRNYSFFIGLTFIIVFLMRNEGKNLLMGVYLSLIPFIVGIYTLAWLRKNKP
jgi:hypothetical protein